MGLDIERAALASARDRDGVVTAAELYALGVSESMIRRRVAAGTWIRMHKAVYLLDATLAGNATTLARAALDAGPAGAVISHLLAAHLYGWQGLPHLEVAEITVPPSVGRRPTAGLVVHRSSVIEAEPLPGRSDIPVSLPVRTIADLAGRLERWRLLAVCDSAVRRRHVSRTSLTARAGEWAGRPGADRLRAIANLADGRSESAFESRFRLLLVDRGLPLPVLQFRLMIDGREYRLDFAYPDVLIAVEVDGRGVHGLPEALLEDRRRQNALQNAGWLVLRFTWDDLVIHPDRVIAEIARALRERGVLPIEA